MTDTYHKRLAELMDASTYTTANPSTTADVTVESLRDLMRKMPPPPKYDLIVMTRAVYFRLIDTRIVEVRCDHGFAASLVGIELRVGICESDAQRIADEAKASGRKVLLCTAATPRGEEGR